MSKIINDLWIRLIKKEVREVTFISFLEMDKKWYVKIKLKNRFGGKDTVQYKMEVHPNEMRNNEWEYILKNLKDRKYEKENDTERDLRQLSTE